MCADIFSHEIRKQVLPTVQAPLMDSPVSQSMKIINKQEDQLVLQMLLKVLEHQDIEKDFKNTQTYAHYGDHSFISNEENQRLPSITDNAEPRKDGEGGNQETATQQTKRGGHRKNRGGSHNVCQRVRARNLESVSGDGSGPSGDGAGLQINEDISLSYEDLGDCTERCHHCGAAFWYEERVQRDSRNNRPEYHLCCRGGSIIMDPEPDPPEYIKNLLSNAHFMENIRAYNQMFAMTSFGATIDKSVKTGPTPYVFKVSGQIYHNIGSLCPLGDDTPRFLQLYIYDTQKEVQNRMSHFSNSEQDGLDPHIVEGLIHFLDTHNELVKVLRTARDLCSQANISEFKIRLYNAEGARGYELPTSNTLGAIVFDNGPTSEPDYCNNK